jgi:RND superfamily putative drug exporter
MSLFARLARFVTRHPVAVIVAWAIAAAAMFIFSEVGWGDYGNLQDRTTMGVVGVRGTDSAFARAATDNAVPFEAGTRYSAMILGVDPTDPALAAALEAPLRAIASTNGVALVVSPLGAIPGASFAETQFSDAGASPSAFVAQGGDGILVLVTLAPNKDDAALLALNHTVTDEFGAVLDAARTTAPGASLETYSTRLLFENFDKHISEDLLVGEAIALPLALIVMVFVFGGFLAASMPIAGAIASIAGGFAILYGFTFPYTVDNSAQSVVTVLGIGLCIDYGLLIVSRYREELAAADPKLGDPRAAAVERAMATAGRTVFFSAVTVGIAVGSLLTFSPDLMKAFGGAALGVVVMALLVAMTLVPALAYVFGHRLERPGLVSRIKGLRRVLSVTADVTRDEGIFSRLTARVQRRPWLVVAGSLAILAILASPALGIQLRNSGLELLPKGDADRVFVSDFDASFPQLRDPDVRLVAEASGAELQAWEAANLASLDGVVGVTPTTESDDLAISGLVLSFPDPGGPDAVNLVKEIRSLDPPFRLYVGGTAANQVDFIGAITSGAPLALGIVILGTFILLFFMTGSLLVPVKALLINTLSLSASIGVAVWIFQHGHLEGPLQFSSVGGLETYVVVLILAFGFGLSMDYEVFLLSRIKELVDRGVPNDEAVRLGLQRSGRIITSAATIVIVVFLGFAAGKILVIKELGVGLAFAVLLDATLVRLLLVPATMTLLGKWNWWAPKPLKRLYARMSITH